MDVGSRVCDWVDLDHKFKFIALLTLFAHSTCWIAIFEVIENAKSFIMILMQYVAGAGFQAASYWDTVSVGLLAAFYILEHSYNSALQTSHQSSALYFEQT